MSALGVLNYWIPVDQSCFHTTKQVLISKKLNTRVYDLCLELSNKNVRSLIRMRFLESISLGAPVNLNFYHYHSQS